MSDILFFIISFALISALVFGLYLDSHGMCKHNWMIFVYFPINYIPLLFIYYTIERLISLFSYYLCLNAYEINNKRILALLNEDNFAYLCFLLYTLTILYQILICICSLQFNHFLWSAILNLNTAIYILIRERFKFGSVLLIFTAFLFLNHILVEFIEEHNYLIIASGASVYLVFHYITWSWIFSKFLFDIDNVEDRPIIIAFHFFSAVLCNIADYFFFDFLELNFSQLYEYFDKYKKLRKQRYAIREISKIVSEPYSFVIYFLFSLFLAFYFIDDILSEFWIFKESLYFTGWMYVAGLLNSQSSDISKRNFILNAWGSYIQFLAFRFIKYKIF